MGTALSGRPSPPASKPQIPLHRGPLPILPTSIRLLRPCAADPTIPVRIWPRPPELPSSARRIRGTVHMIGRAVNDLAKATMQDDRAALEQHHSQPERNTV